MEARKLLGLGAEALSRERLQQAFHRRLFEIHPDTTAFRPVERDVTVDALIEARKTILLSLERQSSGDQESRAQSADPPETAGTDVSRTAMVRFRFYVPIQRRPLHTGSRRIGWEGKPGESR